MDDDQVFEIIESRMTKPVSEKLISPLPLLSKRIDGFNRQDVVNAFARSFEMIGGVQRMALWADANPDKFYPLYSRLLPSTAIQIGIANATIIQHAIPPSDLDKHPEREGENAGSGE